MKTDKKSRCSKLNQATKYRQHQFKVGDWVYVRNRVRNKFEPHYYDEPFIIEKVDKNGVIACNSSFNKRKTRHVDDIKLYTVTKKIHCKLAKSMQSRDEKKNLYFTLPSSDNKNTTNFTINSNQQHY